MTDECKISNCPFCGTIARLVNVDVLISKQKKIFDIFYKVACTHPYCGASTKDWYPQDAAIKAWNCRRGKNE